jgi:hypothetical protein
VRRASQAFGCRAYFVNDSAERRLFHRVAAVMRLQPALQEKAPAERSSQTFNRPEVGTATEHNQFLKHDPEKWKPVFRKDHASPKR